MIYDLLASMYDVINSDIDYVKWADFIENAIERYCITKNTPELILDLGCGSGKMTVELAKRGYDMTGADCSFEMLGLAREYAEKSNLDGKILWLLQDMREFELYGTVDLTVSCLDCINHLTTKKDLEKTFSLVHNYLIPDGLFVFDVNGKSKFENIYADNCYTFEDENGFLIWQNDYNEKNGICDFAITLFSKNADGSYRREDELQREKMYSIKQLRASLEKCGFEFLGAFSDFDFHSATDADERINFVAKCIKNQ